MIFWTLVFFAISLYGLIRGSIFFEAAKRIKLLSIDKAQGKIDADTLGKEFVNDGCLQWIAAVILAVAELIYLVNAFHYDTYKVPTLLAVILFLMAFISASLKKSISKMDEDELVIEKAKVQRSKKITFSNIIKSLVWTVYFGYMLYILVF